MNKADIDALNRLAASRMHLSPHVALADGPAPITLRFKLKRLGLEDNPQAADLIKMVDDVASQNMLKSQSILTRYLAVERNLPSRIIWG